MRKMTLMVLVMAIALLAMPVFAGEYQPESKAYEEAFAAGKYAVAAELAKTGVGKGNALNMQAYAAWKEGDFAGAKKLCLQAIAADPEQYWAHNTLGACLMKELDFDGAIAEFKKSIEVNEKAGDPDAGARVAKAKANLETALRLKGK